MKWQRNENKCDIFTISDRKKADVLKNVVEEIPYHSSPSWPHQPFYQPNITELVRPKKIEKGEELGAKRESDNMSVYMERSGCSDCTAKCDSRINSEWI